MSNVALFDCPIHIRSDMSEMHVINTSTNKLHGNTNKMFKVII
jgi:hypothetical protein